MQKKTRVLSLLLAVVLLFSVPVCCNAEAENSANIDAVEALINRYSFADDILFTIEDSFSMRSFTDNSVQYTLYVLNPYGYAIIYNETNGFMEGCYQANTFVEQMQNGETYYYGGPGNYYVYDGGNYYSLMSDAILDISAIQVFADAEERVHSNELAKEKAPASSTYGSVVNNRRVVVEEAYFSGLTQHGKNDNGTCTVIATAILLGYYDKFVNNDYVADQYRNGNGTTESFHQLLNSYVYNSVADQGGIYIHDAVPKINNYLSDVGISSRMYYNNNGVQARVLDKIVSTLSAGRPLIASMGKGKGAPYNHTVVVYGATYDSATSLMVSAIFQVHMGWGAGYTAVSATGTWFYECGYIA